MEVQGASISTGRSLCPRPIHLESTYRCWPANSIIASLRLAAMAGVHESLKYYGQQAPALLNEMLTSKFDLTSPETAALLSAGDSFRAVLSRIDADAKAEVARRYGADRPTGIARTGPPPSG